MAKLIYATNVSLDDYIEDQHGAFNKTDLTIGGANLAAQALRAGLVDECRVYVWPMVVGSGKPALPTDTRADLELLDERRFENGAVCLRYRHPAW